MKEQLATFRSQLEDCARKHKDEPFLVFCLIIRIKICYQSQTLKWVQIVDICLATRSLNGGLINLQELHDLLCQKRKAAHESVTEDDCLRAISKLKTSCLQIRKENL